MKNFRTFIAIVIVSVFGLSCSDQEKATPTTSPTASSPNLSKGQTGTPVETQGVRPLIEYCNGGGYAVYRTGPWGGLDHYLAKAGKFLGHNSSPNSPLQLRQTYGFNRANIGEGEYSTYVNTYGYAPQNLMVSISKENPGATVDACPGVVEFYTDEPFTKKLWSQQDVITLADYLHSRQKKFGVGEQGFFLFQPSGLLNCRVETIVQ